MDIIFIFSLSLTGLGIILILAQKTKFWKSCLLLRLDIANKATEDGNINLAKKMLNEKKALEIRIPIISRILFGGGLALSCALVAVKIYFSRLR